MSNAQLTARPGSGAMFDSIAKRYDLLNRLMSLGLDQRWRKRTIESLQVQPKDRILDLATGTGDLAVGICEQYPEAQVVGLDASEQMLNMCRAKFAKHQLGPDRATVQLGDATALPFDQDCFDGLCVGFGVRNFPDRPVALTEMHRVLKPGGRLAILELCEPQRGALAPIAKLHVHHIVPLLGALLSGKREYRYLQRSIAAFPPATEFEDMMRSAGFNSVQSIRLGFGACSLFIAQKSEAS